MTIRRVPVSMNVRRSVSRSNMALPNRAFGNMVVHFRKRNFVCDDNLRRLARLFLRLS